MSKPAISPRESWISIHTTAAGIGVATAPGSLVGVEPHFVVPSTGPGGYVTQGFSFALFLPLQLDPGLPSGEATTTTGFYTCGFWRLLPSTSRWVRFGPDISIAPEEEYITYDIGAGAAFYVQISNLDVQGVLFFAVTPLI